MFVMYDVTIAHVRVKSGLKIRDYVSYFITNIYHNEYENIYMKFITQNDTKRLCTIAVHQSYFPKVFLYSEGDMPVSLRKQVKK